ncbi:DUF2226 domain-containing protein [archaeon]
MNIPLGTQEIAGRELSEETVREIISFLDGNKTGYFCITTEGEHGIEDGLMVIEAGNIIGAHYEYMAFEREHIAGEALKRVLNSLIAPKGVYDAYTLTAQQLELLKIFNENILLLERIPLRAFEGMVPVSHSTEYEAQEIAAIPVQRKDVLGKHGLSEIKIDNYAEIKASVEAIAPTPGPSEKVAEKVTEYVTGKPTEKPVVPPVEPTEMPVVEDVKPPVSDVPVEQALDADTTQELEGLNQQAEKLKKLLLKEK